MEYYEVTPASNSTQPDLHKRNHVAQTRCAAAGERILSQFSLISKSSITITRETSIISQKIEGFGGRPPVGERPAPHPKSGPEV